jgi:hypothetical protein
VSFAKLTKKKCPFFFRAFKLRSRGFAPPQRVSQLLKAGTLAAVEQVRWWAYTPQSVCEGLSGAGDQKSFEKTAPKGGLMAPRGLGVFLVSRNFLGGC